MGRNKPITTWTGRTRTGENCMLVIETGVWDDLQPWEDDKLWWDNGYIESLTWTKRAKPTTTWS